MCFDERLRGVCRALHVPFNNPRDANNASSLDSYEVADLYGDMMRLERPSLTPLCPSQVNRLASKSLISHFTSDPVVPQWQSSPLTLKGMTDAVKEKFGPLVKKYKGSRDGIIKRTWDFCIAEEIRPWTGRLLAKANSAYDRSGTTSHMAALKAERARQRKEKGKKLMLSLAINATKHGMNFAAFDASGVVSHLTIAALTAAYAMVRRYKEKKRQLKAIAPNRYFENHPKLWKEGKHVNKASGMKGGRYYHMSKDTWALRSVDPVDYNGEDFSLNRMIQTQFENPQMRERFDKKSEIWLDTGDDTDGGKPKSARVAKARSLTDHQKTKEGLMANMNPVKLMKSDAKVIIVQFDFIFRHSVSLLSCFFLAG